MEPLFRLQLMWRHLVLVVLWPFSTIEQDTGWMPSMPISGLEHRLRFQILMLHLNRMVKALTAISNKWKRKEQ